MRHEEDRLQMSCVWWFEMQHAELAPLLHHSPNGGRRDLREAARFKAMGTRAGFPDLVLMVPRGSYGALCVELKSEKGRVSDTQKEWMKRAENAGNKCVVCRSIEEFQITINDYLK